MTNQHASIFSNCSVHYDLEVNFEICIEATDPCYSIEQIETAVTISYVDYCSSVTLFPLAGFMNIYCLLVILPIYHRLQNNSKKKYIFLITRCIAGLLAVTAWLLLQCVYLRSMTPNTGDSAGYVLALSLYIGSTYVLLGSYVGMAGVLYLGVMNPVGFNQHLTLRLTYIAVCVIFIFALILSIPLAILQAAIAIPISIKCRDKTCAPVVTLINFILVSGSLIITTITLSFVLISLLNHRNAFKRLDTMSNASLNSGIRLLIWTLFVVILITIAEIIPFTFMEIRRSEGTITGCYWFYHAGKVIVEAIFALIESSIWSVALIVDPLTNLILDRTVSRQAASQQIETAVTIAYVDYYSSVTLFSVAGLMNIYCLLVIIPLYRRMQNDSKKKYIFLITRCIAGLLAVVSWLLIQCIYLRFIAPTAGNFPYYVLALTLYIGSTYVLLGSYVGMAGILYLGVLNPISFHQHITLRLVYAAVCIFFLVALSLSIPLATFEAAMAIPVTIKCTDKSCAPLVTLLNFVLVLGSLITAATTILFVLISLLRHRKEFKKQDTVSNTNLNSAIRLLTWTLFALFLISIVEIIPFVFMEVKKHGKQF
ncbi:hypothetical protein GCK72_010613 [Caenorhabditis remanei]|uniref:G-protein coupled receptors family 1 profile domain-containing protein n=1 Tax=Caenorhabditis remanei TaxID=31234 RepID=A0A6A5H5Y6_CAERE|nr:hypothetical protein GCK72_010613 [Caenorhabditis remanei]KAF1762351.1 hypothetical protein GCK72_010613 [Caenorhabditis remanei]